MTSDVVQDAIAWAERLMMRGEGQHRTKELPGYSRQAAEMATVDHFGLMGEERERFVIELTRRVDRPEKQ